MSRPDVEYIQPVNGSLRGENEIEVSTSSIDEDKIHDTSTEVNESFISRGGEGEDGDGGGGAEARPSHRSHVQQVMSLLTFFLPHADPVPWHYFLIFTFFILMPCLVYIFLFTKMGIGLQTFYWVSNNYEHFAPYIAGGLALFMGIFNLMDFTYWNSKWGKRAQMLVWVVFVAGLIFFILCVASDYPYGPISLFAMSTPLWLLTVHTIFYPNIEIRRYVRWLSFPFFVTSVLIGICWIMWTFWSDENEWNETNRIWDAQESGCEPNFEDYSNCRKHGSTGSGEDAEVCFQIVLDPEEIEFDEGCAQTCLDIYDHCLNTFISWCGPLMVSFSLFFFSFFCTFLRTGDDESTEKDVYSFGKLWVLLLFGVWIAASYAGVGPGLSSTLASLTLAGFIGSMVFLSKVLSKHEAEERVMGIMGYFQQKFGAYVDLGRGLLVITCGPLCIPYLIGSFCINCVRTSGCFPWSHHPVEIDIYDEREKCGRFDFLLTYETRKALHAFRGWNRAKVYTIAIYWGLGLLTLQVFVSKFMTIFFSWLIEETSDMSLPVVTGILVLVGMVLFLLPPIPGGPIYLTLGIVSVAVGREQLGVLLCITYGIGVSLGIKLLACTLQQKLIGEMLSNSVATRQMVAINSPVMKATKLVLCERGMSAAKVALLVGGPDWPVSVLCGIMKLDLFPILLGTMPVVLLIIPTTLTGAFGYMSSITNEEGNLLYPWAGTSATVAVAVAAIVQSCALLLAMLFVENVTSARADELESMAIDEDVAESDRKVEIASKAYTKAIKWNTLPIWTKLTLSLSVAFMTGSCYLVQLFQSLCFQEFGLTDSITVNLDGDVLNIVLPLGWVVLAFFGLSCILLIIFKHWAGRKAKNMPTADNESIEDPSGDQLVLQAPGSMRVVYGDIIPSQGGTPSI